MQQTGHVHIHRSGEATWISFGLRSLCLRVFWPPGPVLLEWKWFSDSKVKTILPIEAPLPIAAVLPSSAHTSRSNRVPGESHALMYTWTLCQPQDQTSSYFLPCVSYSAEPEPSPQCICSSPLHRKFLGTNQSPVVNTVFLLASYWTGERIEAFSRMTILCLVPEQVKGSWSCSLRHLCSCTSGWS